MKSTTFDETTNQYFSGQGVVLMGKKDPVTGASLGLLPVGNVSDLKISIATTVVEHKNSQDGQRATDFRLQTDTKATLSMTLDNFSPANIAKALRGSASVIPSNNVAAESVTLYPGLVQGLQFIGISNPIVTQGQTALVGYQQDGTPWDFKANFAAGSLEFNDGTADTTANAGAPVTAIAVGATTIVTVPNSCDIGDVVTISGATGADAAVLNGVAAQVVATSPTAITLNVNTTGKVITVGNAKALGQGIGIQVTVSYSYAAQTKTDALTQPLNDSFVRFEGLNTADDNNPVVVDVFKFSNDPLKELALLSDTVGNIVIEGSLLSDGTRPSGTSKYFTVKKLLSA